MISFRIVIYHRRETPTEGAEDTVRAATADISLTRPGALDAQAFRGAGGVDWSCAPRELKWAARQAAAREHGSEMPAGVLAGLREGPSRWGLISAIPHGHPRPGRRKHEGNRDPDHPAA